MLTFEEKWAKILACDATYDGLFYTAVKTTKIYCRPSCRSRKPKKENVDFYETRQEAEERGFRPCKRCQPDVEHAPWDILVQKITAFLVQHYKQPIRLEHIAEYTKLSLFHLERTFTEAAGETPRQRLERIRIDKASYLLRATAMSNLSVCYEVGFQTPSNFYRVFKRIKGCTPNMYRKGEDV
ncbi:bifunctional transcriptional activator/DNA repair enzyme AdaA [Exiguobacterium qingdaonense]|uniref:bifunctional transcriptional activator/DNA repair enzyme AdaA n=1 Tax=Exiguobacterium qingdaonense TaxID=2751251 RepID=UPI001BEC222B|nr:Ada metal-binding domain-containing protein [Exiguobacterium qingdaonense]